MRIKAELNLESPDFWRFIANYWMYDTAKVSAIELNSSAMIS